MDQLHTVKDTRQILGGISNSLFYEIVRDGKLNLKKIGRRSFVTDSEIQRFVDSLHGQAA